MTASVIPLHPTPNPPVPPLPVHPADRILRLPAVQERIPLSTATIYRHIATGHFPKPIRLGGKSVGWRESEINAWIARGGAA